MSKHEQNLIIKKLLDSKKELSQLLNEKFYEKPTPPALVTVPEVVYPEIKPTTQFWNIELLPALFFWPWLFIYYYKVYEPRKATEIERIRNSPEYRKQCELLDTERAEKQEIENQKYQKLLDEYNEITLPKYEKEFAEWESTRKQKIAETEAEINKLISELIKAIEKTNIDITKYTEIPVLQYIYDVVSTSEHTIEEAIDMYDSRTENDKTHIHRLYRMSTKSGDQSINSYTDAVVKNVKSRLTLNHSNIPVYGGTNYLEWWRLEANGLLSFPNIVVNSVVEFTLDRTSYSISEKNGMPVFYDCTPNSLPLNYSVTMRIEAQSEAELNDIERQIKDMYTQVTIIKIPDAVHADKVCQLNVILNSDSEPQRNTVTVNNGVNIFRSTLVFLGFAGVYYVQDHTEEEVIDNPQLQLRLMQLLLFTRECFNRVDEALRALPFDYKSVLNKNVGFLSSDELKKLINDINNGLPIDRELFDSALKRITIAYPHLYEKMCGGWTYEQIEDDLKKYWNLFNERFWSLFRLLHLRNEYIGPSYSTISDSAISYYIKRMNSDPTCTVEDVLEDYIQICKEAVEEARIARAEQSANEEYYSESSGGGFIKSALSTAAGVAIGNKISGNTNKNRGSGRKDLFGSSICQYGKKRPGSGLKMNYCMGCSAYDRCTQRGKYK